MKDFIAMISMLSKFTFSSRERQVSPIVYSFNSVLLEFHKQKEEEMIVMMLVF